MYFREDMEENCDFVTIQRSRRNAYTYGQLILKSMRILQVEGEDFNMYATFTGDKEYDTNTETACITTETRWEFS